MKTIELDTVLTVLSCDDGAVNEFTKKTEFKITPLGKKKIVLGGTEVFHDADGEKLTSAVKLAPGKYSGVLVFKVGVGKNNKEYVLGEFLNPKLIK